MFTYQSSLNSPPPSVLPLTAQLLLPSPFCSLTSHMSRPSFSSLAAALSSSLELHSQLLTSSPHHYCSYLTLKQNWLYCLFFNLLFFFFFLTKWAEKRSLFSLWTRQKTDRSICSPWRISGKEVAWTPKITSHSSTELTALKEWPHCNYFLK